MNTVTDFNDMLIAVRRIYAMGIAVNLQGDQPTVTRRDLGDIAARINQSIAVAQQGHVDQACQMLRGIAP